MLVVEKLTGKQCHQNCIVFQRQSINKEEEENMDKLRYAKYDLFFCLFYSY